MHVEWICISVCLLFRVTANSYSSFFYPYGAHGPISRGAPTHHSFRYQAEGLSPVQSGIKTFPFLLSLVLCEYDLLFTRKLISKLKISGRYFWSPGQGTVFFHQYA